MSVDNSLGETLPRKEEQCLDAASKAVTGKYIRTRKKSQLELYLESVDNPEPPGTEDTQKIASSERSGGKKITSSWAAPSTFSSATIRSLLLFKCPGLLLKFICYCCTTFMQDLLVFWSVLSTRVLLRYPRLQIATVKNINDMVGIPLEQLVRFLRWVIGAGILVRYILEQLTSTLFRSAQYTSFDDDTSCESFKRENIFSTNEGSEGSSGVGRSSADGVLYTMFVAPFIKVLLLVSLALLLHTFLLQQLEHFFLSQVSTALWHTNCLISIVKRVQLVSLGKSLSHPLPPVTKLNEAQYANVEGYQSDACSEIRYRVHAAMIVALSRLIIVGSLQAKSQANNFNFSSSSADSNNTLLATSSNSGPGTLRDSLEEKHQDCTQNSCTAGFNSALCPMSSMNKELQVILRAEGGVTIDFVSIAQLQSLKDELFSHTVCDVLINLFKHHYHLFGDVLRCHASLSEALDTLEHGCSSSHTLGRATYDYFSSYVSLVFELLQLPVRLLSLTHVINKLVLSIAEPNNLYSKLPTALPTTTTTAKSAAGTASFDIVQERQEALQKQMQFSHNFLKYKMKLSKMRDRLEEVTYRLWACEAELCSPDALALLQPDANIFPHTHNKNGIDVDIDIASASSSSSSASSSLSPSSAPCAAHTMVTPIAAQTKLIRALSKLYCCSEKELWDQLRRENGCCSSRSRRSSAGTGGEEEEEEENRVPVGDYDVLLGDKTCFNYHNKFTATMNDHLRGFISSLPSPDDLVELSCGLRSLSCALNRGTAAAAAAAAAVADSNSTTGHGSDQASTTTTASMYDNYFLCFNCNLKCGTATKDQIAAAARSGILTERQRSAIGDEEKLSITVDNTDLRLNSASKNQYEAGGGDDTHSIGGVRRNNVESAPGNNNVLDVYTTVIPPKPEETYRARKAREANRILTADEREAMRHAAYAKSMQQELSGQLQRRVESNIIVERVHNLGSSSSSSVDHRSSYSGTPPADNGATNSAKGKEYAVTPPSDMRVECRESSSGVVATGITSTTAAADNIIADTPHVNLPPPWANSQLIAGLMTSSLLARAAQNQEIFGGDSSSSDCDC